MVLKGDPVALAVKKDKPIVAHLPHVKKVIDEAPPEYIIMVVVAFLHVFAMTISLVHVINRHRAFTRLRPRMVFPTITMLTFYWIIASLNVIGLVVIRANLLCQTICSCYDALVGYLFAVLCIAYSEGKISYGSITRWRDVIASEYSCSTLCCWIGITKSDASRAVKYIIQLILLFSVTSLAELICENEGLFLYPSPITKSYIIIGIKAVQFLSLLIGFYGFFMLCRAASIVSPRTSPYLKLVLFKCIYILSSIQNNVLVYLAFQRIIPPVSEIAPITRSVVWANFGTVIECTFMYFVATRVYKVDDYTKSGNNLMKNLPGKQESGDGAKRDKLLHDNPELSDRSEFLSDLELDKQDLLSLKCQGLNSKDNYSLTSLKLDNLSLDEDLSPKSTKSKLVKGDRSFRSVEGMLQPIKRPNTRTKTARIMKGNKYSTIDCSKQTYSRYQNDSEEDVKNPKIRVVGGKVHISLSSKDLAKLCKSTNNITDAIRVSLEDLQENLDTESEDTEVELKHEQCIKRPRSHKPRTKCNKKSRNSMQFVKTLSYTNISSDEGRDEVPDPEQIVVGSHPSNRDISEFTDHKHSQYVSKISLV